MKDSSFASKSYEVFFEPDTKSRELEELEKVLSQPDLWADADKAQEAMRRRSRLQESLELAAAYEHDLEEIEVLLELAGEGDDVGTELERSVEALEAKVMDAELTMLLGGPADRRHAVLSIHAGAGGTEAQDWVAMLARQYTRYAESKGFKVDVVDSLPGEEAGLKSITMTVEGEYAYGLLSAERGVHRLVRISPFDQAKRRHTSFASLDVYPEVDEEIQIEVKDEDLRIDTYRSSGRGGQHVNVTDSAVRITHLPTGIVVQCQKERSQHRNREMAMTVLRARLYQLKLDEIRRQQEAENAAKGEISFGNQIRSYVLAPYRMVKDHRTGYEIGDVERVLDGELDAFIRAFLLSGKKGEETAPA